ncbi:NAD(P)/FAD-dependent oxidoreductase [Paraburkholderia tropica]|uniref:NAD(P)/FAD-dependent oxidoreductase n=1 Tax=Paraburkholderia tropica TaxID=92647 RepID=UPI003D2D6DB1
MEVDCIVIGAGVVGLAVARALQLDGRETILLEKEKTFGVETSSRNSEVIHAGIYYEPGSLKARFCVRGKQLLYDYCQSRGIPYSRIGKVIVATREAEIAILKRYFTVANTNGVHDLDWLDEKELHEYEPEVKGVRALFSPSTGIVDSHAYMHALLGDFEMAGGHFVRSTPVIGGKVTPNGIKLQLGDAESTTVLARTVVNCGGLYAPQIARSLEGLTAAAIPESHYAIGHYYTLLGRSPFRHLVYPVAGQGGLGVHVTKDLAGGVRFGPDVRWRDSIDYSFDDRRREEFAQAIRLYYPEIRAEDMAPGYTGIRPKISGADDPNRDFVIQDGAQWGARGLVNLFGIESPGLTSSLAIAEHVCDLARLR